MKIAVVAKGFADTKGNDSSVVNEARRLGKITLVETNDLALLVETASIKRLGYQRLRELFENCCAPSESREWIQGFAKEQVKIPPIRNILYALHKLQGPQQREPIQFADIRAEGLQAFDKREIGEWLTSIASLVPEYISVKGDVVELQMHPDKVLQAIGLNLKSSPATPHRDAMLESILRIDS